LELPKQQRILRSAPGSSQFLIPMKKIDCQKCKQKEFCCQEGAYVDLGEARKITALGLKGRFYHLRKDKNFPSGYRLDTSPAEVPCSFLTHDGLCSIHKIDYKLKPTHCKEFPYENGKLAPFAKAFCLLVD
jgi:hypothetical protein